MARPTRVESQMQLPFAGPHQLCVPMAGRLGSLAGPQQRALSTAFGLAPGSPRTGSWFPSRRSALMAETSEEPAVEMAHLFRGSSSGSRYSRLIGPIAVTWVTYSPDLAQWK